MGNTYFYDVKHDCLECLSDEDEMLFMGKEMNKRRNVSENKIKTLRDFIDFATQEDSINVSIDFSDPKIIDKAKNIIDLLQGRPNVKVTANTKKAYIYEESEMQTLKELDSYCDKKNIEFKVFLNNNVPINESFQNVSIAKKQIDEFKQKVNSFKIEDKGKNRNLSVIEKFFICYKFAADRYYNMRNFSDNRSRNWVGLLSSDQAICSGFASLLECVCDQVFSPEELKCFEQGCDVYARGTKKHTGAHSLNIVRIKDKLYNVDQIFVSDPCWGCKHETYQQAKFDYCLNPLPSYGKHKDYTFEFDEGLYVYNNVEGVELKGGKNHRFSRREIHPLCDLLLKENNQKSSQELLDEGKIAKIANQRTRENIINNQRIFADAKNEISKFLKENNMEDFSETIIPKKISEEMVKKYPQIADYAKQIEIIKKTRKKGELSGDYGQAIKNLYKIHKENPEIINDIINENKKNDFLMDTYAIDVMSFAIVDKKQLKSELPLLIEDDIKDEIIEEYKEIMSKTLKQSDKLINAPNLSEEAFIGGLRAVALFGGLTKEDDIKRFINQNVCITNYSSIAQKKYPLVKQPTLEEQAEIKKIISNITGSEKESLMF